MNSSKLKNLGKDINNPDRIKVSELKKMDIKSEDVDPVKGLIKRIRKKLSLNFIFISLAVIFGSLILFNDIESVSQMLNLEFLGLSAIPLVFIFLLFYIGKQIRITSITTYKKAQYGLVENKYSMKSGSSNSKKRIHYVNVLFEDTNTTLTGVKCSKEDYRCLSEGSPLLVISFDDKKAYGLPLG